ncbi:MAG: tetratricopeptide repeat protein [Acidobacteriota bacterium]|nr:tetratricopeptide repeat protein [Acidobacteriota bacterium]
MSYFSFILLLAWQGAPAQNASNTPQPAPARPLLSAQDRGDILMARKMYREAIDTYKEAPETAILMNKIGIAYHQLADLGSAANYYSRAAKLDSKYAEPINNLGTVYYSRGSYRRAIGQYKKSLRIKPESASTLANLGSAYFARKQNELGMQYIQKAMEVDPKIFENRSGVGTVVRDRTVVDRPMFFYYMAKVHAKKGMYEQALNYIRKALEEGFRERRKFVDEPEFAGLQKDPEFQKIMAMEPKVL